MKTLAENNPWSDKPANRCSRIALLGATITGNRGAESILRGAVQRIPEFVPDVRFSLLSLYPRDDAAENRDPNLEIVPCTPLHLVFIAFPLALGAYILRRLHLPHKFLLCTRSLRKLQQADLAIDLSGISFVDGRGLILLYNVLLVLVPDLLGTRLLKYSQALGPFESWLNRRCAQWLLPKVARIAARGRITKEFLDTLDLPPEHVHLCADAAFAMKVGAAAAALAVEQLRTHSLFNRPVVCVSASSVVHRLCQPLGINYRGELADFIGNYLISQKGYNVLLIAHSARPGKKSAKNNDLFVCRAICDMVARPDRCRFPDEIHNAEVLRALIGECRLLVASRFHAMVSGLAMCVPTMQIGWSHKYAEVLEAFDIEGFALDYANLSSKALRDLFECLEQEEEEVRSRIRETLPSVIESSLDNARLAAELLDRQPVSVPC